MRPTLVVLSIVCMFETAGAREALLGGETPPEQAAVGAPDLVLVGVEAQGGNGDIWVEPGETVNVRLELQNTGNEQATSVFGTLSYLGDNPQVTILDKVASWPNLVAKGAPQF